MKWVLLFSLVVMMNFAFADTPSNNNSQTPQTAPNIVVSNSPEAQKVAAQLFSRDATYKKFKRYNIVKLFKISGRDDD